MHMVEALTQVFNNPDELWARPVEWRGLGFGIAWQHNRGWQQVPTPWGGSPVLLPHPHSLFAEWEVVKKEVARKEGGGG